MQKAVKIKTLAAPEGDLSVFDPGKFLSQLEFVETEQEATEADRDGLAQFVHLLAFMALQNQSTNWPSSRISLDSSAYAALHSHFSHLEGWSNLVGDEGISYRALVTFLMPVYPPHPPRKP